MYVIHIMYIYMHMYIYCVRACVCCASVSLCTHRYIYHTRLPFVWLSAAVLSGCHFVWLSDAVFLSPFSFNYFKTMIKRRNLYLLTCIDWYVRCMLFGTSRLEY